MDVTLDELSLRFKEMWSTVHRKYGDVVPLSFWAYEEGHNLIAQHEKVYGYSDLIPVIKAARLIDVPFKCIQNATIATPRRSIILFHSYFKFAAPKQQWMFQTKEGLRPADSERALSLKAWVHKHRLELWELSITEIQKEVGKQWATLDIPRTPPSKAYVVAAVREQIPLGAMNLVSRTEVFAKANLLKRDK